MSYGRFAYVYDFLMSDVPYDNWINLFISKKEQYNISGSKVLDVACGTGEFSVRLAEKGYSVTGVDLSDEMLAIAKVKADQSGVAIPFYQQNMIELDMGQQFDSIVIFCDSLNYLHTESDVQSTFQRVYEQLKQGGLFMFDVHSLFKMEHVFAGQTFADVQEEVSYIWNSFEGAEPFSVEHELTFFVKEEDSDRYDRFDEDHYQRTYDMQTYTKWLKEAGFTVKEVLADLEDRAPAEDSERILFVAIKE